MNRCWTKSGLIKMSTVPILLGSASIVFLYSSIVVILCLDLICVAVLGAAGPLFDGFTENKWAKLEQLHYPPSMLLLLCKVKLQHFPTCLGFIFGMTGSAAITEHYTSGEIHRTDATWFVQRENLYDIIKLITVFRSIGYQKSYESRVNVTVIQPCVSPESTCMH